jgi:hypothetical protein
MTKEKNRERPEGTENREPVESTNDGTEYIDQRGKTKRAFRAYQDVLDTAEWFRRKLRDQLETFGLTLWEFRLLELIYREEPLATSRLSNGAP